MSIKYRQAEKHLANITAHRALNALICDKDPKFVLRNVETIVGRATSSPLRGTLIAVKDNICTTDHPTSCASRILSIHVSPFAATVVTKLKAAGAFIHGKTNMDEFGMGSHSQYSPFGRVLSSVGSELSAGGSSGGSAVAVATDQCYAALGTDTGGSVRLPAAYTGVIGFKSSYGLISRYGVIPYANSLDTVGILACNVGRVREVFNAINGHDPRDPTSLSPSTRSLITAQRSESPIPKKFKIGIPSEFNTQELDPAVRSTWLRTLLALHKKGHSIHTVSLPRTSLALPAYYIIAPAEASSNLAKYDGVRYGEPSDKPRDASDVLYARTRGEGFGAEVQRRILLGAYSLSATARDNYFLQAQRVRRLIQEDFDRIFRMRHPLLSQEIEVGDEGVDVLVSPTAMSTPPKVKDLDQRTAVDVYGDDVLTVPASLAGLPAISIPAKAVLGEAEPMTEETVGGGLPVGIQIMGQYGSDDLVLRVAESMMAKE